MTGRAPLGRGLASQSSRHAAGSQPSVARGAAIHGSVSVSLRWRQWRPRADGRTAAPTPGAPRPGWPARCPRRGWAAGRRPRPCCGPAGPGRMGELERVQPDLDRGLLPAEHRQHARREIPACRDVQADGQDALDGQGRVAGGRGGAAEFGQRGTRTVQEAGARGRDRRPAAAPLQQLDAEDALELLDLGAQHLLGDVHAAGGRGEAAFLRDRDEVTQVPDLDAHRGRSYPPRDRPPGNAEPRKDTADGR